MTTKLFQGMTDVKRANREAGYFFFNRDTLAFFGSKVESSLYDGRVFITSEWDGFDSRDLGYPRGRRVFTVREAHADGHIRTVDVDDVTSSHLVTGRGRRMIDRGRFSHLIDAQQYARDYVRGVSYVIETNYGYGDGYELTTNEPTHLHARTMLDDYVRNHPEYRHRIRRVRADADN